ncbi:MAG: double-strand break repair protein AddB [Alphaproteobacteria bacterium]|nr:double-strand break repair protein AddB [Alphaproteobacteria bacterium]
MTGGAKVFSIPAGVPFLPALAAGIRGELGDDPLVLARATVLLPNRRATRALGEAFLAASGGKALLLPRIAAVGDVDEDELVLTGSEAALDAAFPPAIDPVARNMLLARLVAARADIAPSPAAAYKLAGALCELLDAVQIEEAGFERFATLVPADYAEHWGKTLEFLEILREAWPKILAERGEMDPQERRVRLVRALAAHWAKTPPGPVWAAGSTGSVPATAHLLSTIARLPQGAVVLPGLDLNADAATWEAIGSDPSHPQFGLHHLLQRMEVVRTDVKPWPEAQETPRSGLVATALLPATQTGTWRNAPKFDDAAFAGLARYEAADADGEAGTVALLLREALETPGRTAALVTADRNLARRVAAKLARWGIEIDDTAGRPISRMPPATFLRLVAAAAHAALAPVALLALVKHPLVAMGRERAAHLADVRRLDRKVLRGPRPAPGIDGLRAALAGIEGVGTLHPFIDALDAALAPIAKAGPDFAAQLDAHVAAAERLASDASGLCALWSGEAGEALARSVSGLRAAAPIYGELAPERFADFLEALLEGAVFRPVHGGHPRLAIRGTLEARLVSADRLILGGLNEGSWPGEAQEDPWLSRPMRAAVGLSQPERQIGLSAHDFAQALSCADVVLTRARKVDGTPMLPSRWLSRLDALLGTDARWHATLGADAPAWDRVLAGAAEKGVRLEPPRPTPPVEARPRRLSVTRIERLLRDPYSIYAQYCLRLSPLDPIDADADAMVRGNLIHEALDRFARAFPAALPEDALAHLVAIGRELFAPLMTRPVVSAFWWPGFEAIAAWFIGEERERRANGLFPVATETKGRLDIGGFELHAKADRIDRGPDGKLVVADYKTGKVPTKKQVASGLNGQLPLTAAIARAGGFPDVPAASVAELAYVKFGMPREPGTWQIVVPSKEAANVDALADRLVGELRNFVRRYDDPKFAYLSRPRPVFVEFAGDYDHLARWREWSQGGGE